MPTEDAVPLAGGNMGTVVRMGDTVRRPAGPWTPNVHRLMLGLLEHGLHFVPRPITASEDYESIEFLSGEVGIYPMPQWVWRDDLLAEVGKALRQLHDVSSQLDLPTQGWRLPAVEPVECVCHGDIAPYNTVCADGRLVGFIDWDFAVPGPRLWDLGYAAYRWVSLTPARHPDGRDQNLTEQRRRLQLLCDAYGDVTPTETVEWAVKRLDHLVALSLDLAAAGDAAFQATIAAGHVRLYENDAAWLRQTYLDSR
jgi:hypothetical protein